MFKSCVIVPVYNHEQALPFVLEKLSALNVFCILVNDGSTEACQTVMRTLVQQYDNMLLLEHEINQGKGAAVKTAMAKAQSLGFSHALQIDADGQHDFDDIPKFIALAEKYPDKIINGNALYDESVPKARYYGRYLTHALVWLNTGSMAIKDTMCGFRVYPVDKIMQVFAAYTVGNRMDFDVEVIVRSVWCGITTLEVPTKVKYPLDGVSHFRMVKDNSYMVMMHIRLLRSKVLLHLSKKLLRKVGL